MTESAQTLLERFQLVRVPSLPHLFLHSAFPAKGRKDAAAAHPVNLMLDPFLCLRLLGSRAGEQGLAGDDVDALTGKLPAGRLETLFSSAALHTGFAETGELPLNFYKGHWRQSMLCSALMRELARRCGYLREKQAALCGLLLDCGEVVLENVFAGQYLELHSQAASEDELLTLEREQFGLTHAELGAELLAGWKLDPHLAEALRYHHESAAVMRDAGKLPRLAWLARVIAAGDTPREEVEEHARRLLHLEPSAVDAVVTHARVEVDEKERTLRIRAACRRLPLADARSDEIAAQDEVARLQLRQRLMSVSLFNAVRADGRPRGLSETLGDYLSLLFGLRRFALFRHDPVMGCLRAVAGQPGAADLEELEINCGERSGAEGRSVVLSAFEAGEPRSLDANGTDASRLSVLDRQLLSLLGARRLFCDPLPANGRAAAVLVLGYNSGEIDYYLEQSLTLPLFKQALAGLLDEDGDAGAASAELLHQQRVREVIHEVNNPLGIIKNYLQLLGMQEQDRPRVVEEIGVLKSEIDRIAAILQKLRGDGAPEEPVLIDLNAVVGKLAKVFASSIIKERGLKLTLDLDPDLPSLRSSENALKQVITNLVVNAAEALPPQGTIVVSTRAGIHSDSQRFVEMTVSDDGPGISAAVVERLFSRANTTKGPVHAGDGLAIVKALVDGLDGRLSCRTGRQGTTFVLVLPLSVPERPA